MVVLDFSYDHDLSMPIDCKIEVPDSDPLYPLGDYPGYKGEWELLKPAPPRVGSGCRRESRPTIHLDLGLSLAESPPKGRDLLLMWIGERGEWVGIEETSHLEGLTFGDYKEYEGPYALNETHGLKILEAYRIPKGSLSPINVLKTSPSELEKLVSQK